MRCAVRASQATAWFSDPPQQPFVMTINGRLADLTTAGDLIPLQTKAELQA
ncbi:MAG TPA: hypothetical protein VHW24_19960 [Bryobacteraceae bacterium]|jgi:hypothetical protein|nr:hypothetical protein [Bryobacteraceae bacterium]